MSVNGKAPASPVIDTREGIHSTNMIPFIFKLYKVIRGYQKMREKCNFKKKDLINKKY